jgi:hypothetical protein
MIARLKKGAVVGITGGTAAAVLVFALCFWASTWPALGPVSLTWSFRPWWRASNWAAALVTFICVAVLLGFRAVRRAEPVTRK